MKHQFEDRGFARGLRLGARRAIFMKRRFCGHGLQVRLREIDIVKRKRIRFSGWDEALRRRFPRGVRLSGKVVGTLR